MRASAARRRSSFRPTDPAARAAAERRRTAPRCRVRVWPISPSTLFRSCASSARSFPLGVAACVIDNATASPAVSILEGMTWQEFEMLVGEGFRLQGYSVLESGGGGPDGGVDLVLRRGGALDQAAQEFGARIAELRFVETQESGRSDLPSLARLLGRMYDAIDSGTLAASTVNVRQGAGVLSWRPGKWDPPSMVRRALSPLRANRLSSSMPRRTALCRGSICHPRSTLSKRKCKGHCGTPGVTMTDPAVESVRFSTPLWFEARWRFRRSVQCSEDGRAR